MAAALVRHGFSSTTHLLARQAQHQHSATRCYAPKKTAFDRKLPPRIDATAKSIAAKGFLRPQREYVPPQDVNEKLDEVFQKCAGTSELSARIDAEKKFDLLHNCYKAIGHGVPNSLLYKMETLQDLKNFYETPIDVRTPFDKLVNMDLPPNLHVQREYCRFHPDTDTKFGGVTAFPESSTLVTGLKYKDKYKGFKAQEKWPQFE